jgi:ankyrin repeat protein
MLGAYLVDQAARFVAAQAAHPSSVETSGTHGACCDFFKAVTDGELGQVARLAAADPTLVKACAGGSTPLALAAFLGNMELVRFLLNHGAPVDQPLPDFTRATPLHCCVARSQTRIAGLLLDFGADVDARQIGGFTPLHTAAQNGDVEMARLLLAYSPDVNARHAEGGTALSIALDWGHTEMAGLLRQHGASD